MRLIDADALINQKPFTAVAGSLSSYEEGYLDCAGDAREAIQNAPAIDPESLRPKGKWIKQKKQSSWDCSICGDTVGAYIAGCANYCPNCGAKMKGAGENDC